MIMDDDNDPARLALQLQEAIDLYEQQLEGVQQLLAAGSADADVLQLKEELEQALQEARAAYSTGFADAAATAASAAATADGAASASPTTAQAAPAPPAAPPGASMQALPTAAAVSTPAAPSLLLSPRATAAAQTAAQGQRRPGNARMHPANVYHAREPDFAALAARHPDLARFVTLASDNSAKKGSRGGGSSGRGGSNGRHSGSGRATIDFTSWEATRALTAALLSEDYGVTWGLQEGQLVPPVTNRANYVHWVADLLQLSSPPGAAPVRGLDVGCGANLIYCLLGAAIHGWHMVGVDITDAAIAGAHANVEANPHLEHLLEVRRVSAQDPVVAAEGAACSTAGDASSDSGGILTPALASADEHFHFCMCNPPFFSSLDEANQNPNTACGGTPAEMVCPGGELAFIRRMVADSVQLRGSFHWYTTMVGKKDSLKAIRTELHALGVTALRTTELAQGKTSRWAIAWSFTVDRNLASQPLPKATAHQALHTTQTTTPTTAQRPREHGNSQLPPSRSTAANQPAAARPAAAAAPAVPAAVLPVRQTSFKVLAQPQEAPKLLQALAALLMQRGAACTVDVAAYTVQAQLPLMAGTSGDGDQQRQQKQQQQHGGDKQQQAGEQRQQKQQPRHEGEQQQEGQQHKQLEERGQQGPTASQRPAKRAKTAAADPGPAAASLSIRMSLFQQQRGMFSIKVTIPNSTGDVVARRFAMLMLGIRSDIDLMWRVQLEP